jgi:2-pyrone-4,6-dicarboxylate lactonase
MTSATPAPLPALACNAHCHVVGPRARFPFAADASYTPAHDATKEDLLKLNDSFGLQRCVIVQSSAHGLDLGVTEDALASRAADYRGIALLPVDVSDAELLRLDRAGFRGARFNYMGHLARSAPIADVIAFGARLEALGWHLQLHGDPQRVLIDYAPVLRQSPVPVVIDHMGRIDASLGLGQPAFQALLRLLDDPRFWVKVSGCDRITRSGPPYDDALPYAAKLVAEHGDRVLWGNDWPHPNHAEAVVDEALICSLIMRMAPSAQARQRLLVDNPQRLYRFDERPA